MDESPNQVPEQPNDPTVNKPTPEEEKKMDRWLWVAILLAIIGIIVVILI